MTDTQRGSVARRVRALVVVGCSVTVVAVASIWLAVSHPGNPPARADGGAPTRPGLPESTGAPTGPSRAAGEPTYGNPADDGPAGGSGHARSNGPRRPLPALPSGPASAPSPTASDDGEVTTPADLFTRRDPLPDGVAAQLEDFIGGTEDPGPEPASGVPTITLPDSVERLSDVGLSFWNFDPQATLAVRVTGPTGSTETLVLDPPNYGNTFYLQKAYLPGKHPIGTYVVRAKQGVLEASVTFTLRHATKPRMMIERTNKATFLYLGGFLPKRPTTVHMYGGSLAETLDRLPYRASFAVPVDAAGEARVRINVGPKTAEGHFAFTAAGLTAPAPELWVTS